METLALITGTRAEYGLLAPICEACRSSGIDAEFLVTGMHLESEFGNTAAEIETAGHPIRARVPMHVPGGTPRAYGRSIGVGVAGMVEALDDWGPDGVLVLGDRTEAFAGAVAGAALGLTVIHVHGGERTRGGLDESLRHAITKLAHVHFTATPKSRERVVRMGEPEEHVHAVGAPGLDTLLREPRPTRQELATELGCPLPSHYWLLLQHSVSTDWELAREEIETTLDALCRTGQPIIAIEPNSDPGGDAVRAGLNEATLDSSLTRFPSVTRRQYLGLLEHATALVGNSSSGLLEAPSLGTPVVNVGTRQDGRERGLNVIDAPADASAIARALARCREDQPFLSQCDRRENPYGDGGSSERIAAQLKSWIPDPARIQKQITY